MVVVSRCLGSNILDVVAFEIGFHGAIRDAHSRPSCPCEVSPLSVSNPIRVLLDSDTINNILGKADDLSTFSSIFWFWGFWPSLANLHALISKYWETILDHEVHIFLMARGFFIVKFKSVEDRKTILCNYNFSWEDRFSLMAKPWHVDFDPLTKSFNRVPI